MSEDGLENVYAWAIPLHATVILAEMIYSHVSEAKLYSGKDLVYWYKLNERMMRGCFLMTSHWCPSFNG